METRQTIEVAYSFDDLNIFGVYGNEVYLKGTYDIKNECIIKISRSLFKKSLDYWLTDKKDYCERYGHFCGAMGSIRSTDFEEVIGEFEDKEPKVYKINSIESDTDMEHG